MSVEAAAVGTRSKRRCLWCLGGWGSTYHARLSFGVLRVGTDSPGRAGGRQ